MTRKENLTVVTAGATYLDIDAYACSIAMAELLRLQGENAIAFSDAPCNYSVCASLTEECRLHTSLPEGCASGDAKYIIVDVSDPDYLSGNVPLDNVIAVYDHHVGFEDYWTSRIGANAHIEFIGAAATLIYREWKKARLADKMQVGTAKLLIAAILDNTLNLTSSVTTKEDRETFSELCNIAGVDETFSAAYFSEVQKSVETDLKNALFGDVKSLRGNPVLPSYMGQIAVWNVESVIDRLPEIRAWFDDRYGSWMLNIIDIQHNCNYFVCDSTEHQAKIEKVLDVQFKSGIAKTPVSYLRKEIIKKTVF